MPSPTSPGRRGSGCCAPAVALPPRGSGSGPPRERGAWASPSIRVVTDPRPGPGSGLADGRWPSRLRLWDPRPRGPPGPAEAPGPAAGGSRCRATALPAPPAPPALKVTARAGLEGVRVSQPRSGGTDVRELSGISWSRLGKGDELHRVSSTLSQRAIWDSGAQAASLPFLSEEIWGPEWESRRPAFSFKLRLCNWLFLLTEVNLRASPGRPPKTFLVEEEGILKNSGPHLSASPAPTPRVPTRSW